MKEPVLNQFPSYTSIIFEDKTRKSHMFHSGIMQSDPFLPFFERLMAWKIKAAEKSVMLQQKKELNPRTFYVVV